MAALIEDEITFRKLEILLAFLKTGNLTRAAGQLGVITASVHCALDSLETGTRCALFRMDGRNLLPNEATHALAETARAVLHTVSEDICNSRALAGFAAACIRI